MCTCGANVYAVCVSMRVAAVRVLLDVCSYCSHRVCDCNRRPRRSPVLACGAAGASVLHTSCAAVQHRGSPVAVAALCGDVRVSCFCRRRSVLQCACVCEPELCCRRNVVVWCDGYSRMWSPRRLALPLHLSIITPGLGFDSYDIPTHTWATWSSSIKACAGCVPCLQILDCGSSRCDGANGCNGGGIQWGLDYVVANQGQTASTAYPYTGSGGEACNTQAAGWKVRAHVTIVCMLPAMPAV